MHIADFGVGMLGANGVVGANLLIAAGAAHGIKLRGEERVVLNIFGDGAINRGPFLEALNWARLYELPVVFVCEDNRFAATTVRADMTSGDGPVARAAIAANAAFRRAQGPRCVRKLRHGGAERGCAAPALPLRAGVKSADVASRNTFSNGDSCVSADLVLR